MKPIALLIALFTLTAQADIILSPGETRIIGSERVACMGGPIPPTRPQYVCVYNYTDPAWGIHIAKAFTETSARTRALQMCAAFKGEPCNGMFVTCEQEPADPFTTYSCEYSYPSYGYFFASARTRLEATSSALQQCEARNRTDCNSAFVTCNRD